VLRLSLELDGDKVVKCDPVIGYLHRGDEKIAENMTYNQFVPYTDRLDYLAPLANNVAYAIAVEKLANLKLPARFLVVPPAIRNTMSEYLSAAGVSQLAISETQKFGHVTYFWNGNKSGYFDASLETYEEVPSDRGGFEERPWMKAAEIVDATLRALKTGRFDHVRLNFANGDMVGHTGDLEAAVLAVQTVDLALGRLLAGLDRMGGVALVTADHGNADEMFERGKGGAFAMAADGRPKPRTSHTLNPVPCMLFDPRDRAPARLAATVERPGLANVAATTLELLGLAPPEDYAPSLLTPR
jgi:2,3-bisphosphoglycerate-independent phosphoglycerate mutase